MVDRRSRVGTPSAPSNLAMSVRRNDVSDWVSNIAYTHTDLPGADAHVRVTGTIIDVAWYTYEDDVPTA